MGKYEDLSKLDELRRSGVITDAEYEQEKAQILNSGNGSSALFGMDEKTYLVLMHLSQFAGFILPGLGFAAPIIMWVTNKENPNVDKTGRNVLNFMLSMLIYFAVSFILSFLLIGIPMLIILGIIEIVFIVVAAIKASNNEYWQYPMSIKFFS
jgi:uncharacterized Tic20 family protein